MATWAHSPGRSGRVSSSSTNGRQPRPKTTPSRRRPARKRSSIVIRRPRGTAAAGFADRAARGEPAVAARATWAHSPGRSGRVSRHAQPRTSAALREPTANHGQRTTRLAADLRGSGTVGRDPRVAMVTWAHSPGRSGLVSSSSTNGRQPRPKTNRLAADLRGSGSSIVIRRRRGRLPPGSRIHRGWAGVAAMARWAHSPGRSGLVSRTAQPHTSAVLRAPTAATGQRPPRLAAALRGS